MATNKRSSRAPRRHTAKPQAAKASAVGRAIHELGAAAPARPRMPPRAFARVPPSATEYREAVADEAEHLHDAATEACAAGRERVAEIEQSLEDRIRANPLQSVLIACGIGILIGCFWNRR